MTEKEVLQQQEANHQTAFYLIAERDQESMTCPSDLFDKQRNGCLREERCKVGFHYFINCFILLLQSYEIFGKIQNKSLIILHRKKV